MGGDSGGTAGRCAIVSHSHLAPFSRTGKMPVPQRVDFLVGWASCPNRQDACSTKSRFSCGVGILPARERLINNSARYSIVGNRDFRACS